SRAGAASRRIAFGSRDRECALPMRRPKSSCGPDSFVFQLDLAGPIGRGGMEPEFGDLLEIESGRPVVGGSHFQRATETGFGVVKIPPLKRLERLGKGFAPGPGRFRLIAQADQFVNLDGLLEAFEPKTA